ncbi:short-chain dehydrogenase/reductase SDR [Fibrisoma limi BUZ 3]|uniref:Short-chain dehydrogenase/reductase SDR n=1 Tax=Fibrisoma limi BUZ 3 TaxID=1185876 RepID=I2GD81_9BACT|nr:SDR family NAD(P)-dependent oxidoreductase [Fibrisoma limi]CCH51855.1 short-chain dehydrogenase/reductase SDR [Fibrisoma limi BUZ 3]
MKLHGQCIVLTGGTSGVGLALLKALHQRGNQLVVVGRNEARIAELQATFPDVTFLRANLASTTDVANLILTLQRDFGNCSVLINNAGVQFTYTVGDNAEGQSRIASEIQINLTAPIQLTDALLPTMRRQPAAAIINVTSGLGISPKRSAPVYSGTKAGLQVFSKAMRYQLEGTRVQVVDVVLPLVDTPMTAGRGRGKISPEQVARELIGGVERGRSVVNVGKVKLFRVIHRLAPGLADHLLKNG